MRKLSRILVGLLGFALCASLAAALAKENPGFNKMKTLVGEWEGKAPDGKAVEVSYRLVSNGTALMETLRPAAESEMVTVYTADGARVAMTHYCNANNQPRMRSAATSGGPQKLDFSFVGATNLADPSAGHMHRLAVAFQDGDHFTQTWTWRENGKDKTETFSFARKK